MKPTLHMPQSGQWQDLYALGMIWHRLRDNIETVRHCRDLVIDAKPPAEEEEMDGDTYEEHMRWETRQGNFI